VGDMETFVRCPGDIYSVSWRYLMDVLEIFDGCPLRGVLDIFICVTEIFDGCPGDI